MNRRKHLGRRNRALALACVGVVAFMVGSSFAAVPLYRLFCQVTGFGGATVRAERAPGEIVDRVVTVRFNADIDRNLPWQFKPAQREVKLRLGEQGLAFYDARNLAAYPVVGTAAFNVTPDKAGAYFNKIQCFCFDEQTLKPGERAAMGVSFFVDPALAKDRDMDDVDTITLSYTFFRAKAQPRTQPQTSAVPAAPKPIN